MGPNAATRTRFGLGPGWAQHQTLAIGQRWAAWDRQVGQNLGLKTKIWGQGRAGSAHKQRGPSSVTRHSPVPQSMVPGTLRVQLVTQRRLFFTR